MFLSSSSSRFVSYLSFRRLLNGLVSPPIASISRLDAYLGGDSSGKICEQTSLVESSSIALTNYKYKKKSAGQEDRKAVQKLHRGMAREKRIVGTTRARCQ